MGDVWGRRIRLSIFGESRGTGIGIVIDGLPAGFSPDLDAVKLEMKRRAPGQNEFSSARNEPDEPEIISGLFNGKTTGSALCAIIYNKDAKDGDCQSAIKPGHAHFSAAMRFGGHSDLRGGGHFSGRLAAPLVFAGSISKQLLSSSGIQIFSRIVSIGSVRDDDVKQQQKTYFDISQKDFQMNSSEAAKRAKEAIRGSAKRGDSLGGVCEVIAFGVPAGLGDPFFHSVESVASSLFFSIPAVKGVEFGSGFSSALLCGSEMNDTPVVEGNSISFSENRNGGILGGITNGMPVLARLAVKPTPGISSVQKTVDPHSMQEIEVAFGGRNDPCIVPRVLPVAESALALAILDCMPERCVWK